MWLFLDLESIKFYLRINAYSKTLLSDGEREWCFVDLTLDGKDWLHYELSSEILVSCEVDEIRDAVKNLLNNRIPKPCRLEFYEPDLTIDLFPQKDLRNDPKVVYVKSGCEIVDVNVEFQIHLWDHGAASANYLSLFMDRADLEHLLIYLQYVTGEASLENEAVQKRLQCGVFRN